MQKPGFTSNVCPVYLQQRAKKRRANVSVGRASSSGAVVCPCGHDNSAPRRIEMVHLISFAGVSAAVFSLAPAVFASAAAAFTITFSNECSTDIELYTRLASIYTDHSEIIAPGASVDRTIGKGFEGHFRNGSNVAATLVEFATKGDLDLSWFDASIIPSALKPGYEYCKSLEECKQNSYSGIGYNTPVQITPLSNTNGKNCREITCLADGCEDAYQFPKDDIKTHSCPFGTNYIVTFCPSGGATQQTEVDPTPAYGDTTDPETIAPVTEADSPEQTTVSGDTNTGVKNETENTVPVVTTEGTPVTTPATSKSKYCI